MLEVSFDMQSIMYQQLIPEWGHSQHLGIQGGASPHTQVNLP
jgi:hypothetical protein